MAFHFGSEINLQKATKPEDTYHCDMAWLHLIFFDIVFQRTVSLYIPYSILKNKANKHSLRLIKTDWFAVSYFELEDVVVW